VVGIGVEVGGVMIEMGVNRWLCFKCCGERFLWRREWERRVVFLWVTCG